MKILQTSLLVAALAYFMAANYCGFKQSLGWPTARCSTCSEPLPITRWVTLIHATTEKRP